MDGMFLLHDQREGTRANPQGRPRSAKEVKEIIQGKNPSHTVADLVIEGTSFFGDPYSGPLTDAPDDTYHFAGPCPHTSRRFYFTVRKSGSDIKFG